MKHVLPAALGAVTAVAAMTCAAALAARVPTEVSHSQTDTANEQTVVDARCPHGRNPVSGGFELVPGDGTFAFNSAEGIDLNRKRWSVNTVASGGAAQTTSHAYCSRLGKQIQFRSDRIDLNEGDSATLTPTCKRDEKVLSGGYGFVSSGLAAGVVEQSFRADPRTWSISGTNFGEDKVTMLAFAHCVPRQKAPNLATVKNAVPFPEEGPIAATATCPSGRYALSGGYRVPSDEPAFFDESRRIGARGWRVADSGGINGRDGDLVAVAYCARK